MSKHVKLGGFLLCLFLFVILLGCRAVEQAPSYEDKTNDVEVSESSKEV